MVRGRVAGQQLADEGPAAEDRALKDLCELQRLGIPVRWPKPAWLSPCTQQQKKTDAEPGLLKEMAGAGKQKAKAWEQERAEEDIAVQQDRRELQMSGLKVQWT